MNLKPDDDFLQMLISGKGQQYLDRQIQRLRVQMGQQQFQQFADQYFKNQGQQNVYATKKQTNKEKYQGNTQKQQQNKNPIQAKICQNGDQGQELKYLEDSPKLQLKLQGNKENQTQVQTIQQNDQGTTNNQQGLVQVSREVLPDGNTKIVYNNGDYYEGEVQGACKSGWGTYFYNNGEKYCGIFVEDEIQGYGRYYFLSGAQYQGDWSSGMKHGIGILKFANKDVYEGSFCKDQFHGNGTYRYHNGAVFQGKWKFGKKEGKGKYEGMDGHIQIGEWKDDKFQI